MFGRQLRAARTGIRISRERYVGGRSNCDLGVRLLTPGELAAIDGQDGADEVFDLTG